MDKETIQQIATEVVARLPFGDHLWLVLVVNAVVAALIGALVVLVTSYLRTRGQNLATKHDFDELQRQLTANTELVEAIKSEVSQKDWAKREWTNLRRIKLETLLAAVHDCEAYLEGYRIKALKSEAQEERDPVRELNTAVVYLPELTPQVTEYARLHSEERAVIAKLAAGLVTQQPQSDARQRIWDEYIADLASTYQKHHDAAEKLCDAARRVLVDIVGVQD
jgi:hypothetical protein